MWHEWAQKAEVCHLSCSVRWLCEHPILPLWFPFFSNLLLCCFCPSPPSIPPGLHLSLCRWSSCFVWVWGAGRSVSSCWRCVTGTWRWPALRCWITMVPQPGRGIICHWVFLNFGLRRSQNNNHMLYWILVSTITIHLAWQLMFHPVSQLNLLFNFVICYSSAYSQCAPKTLQGLNLALMTFLSYLS